MDEDRIMIIDEEGKFQEPIAVNMAATEIAKPFLWPNDFIAGHALVCASDELK